MKNITIDSSFLLNTFSSDKFLKNIQEPFSVSFSCYPSEIPAFMFSYSHICSIDIPSSVTEIGRYAFSACRFLRKINLPNTISIIRLGAFLSCSSIEEITIPHSITIIENNIFADCTSLKNIKIQMSKDYFLLNVEGAKEFLNKYENRISFQDSFEDIVKSSDTIESIINKIDF